MFAYTNNSPINYWDINGHIFVGLLCGMAVGCAVFVTNTIYQNKKAQKEISNNQWKPRNNNYQNDIKLKQT